MTRMQCLVSAYYFFLGRLPHGDNHWWKDSQTKDNKPRATRKFLGVEDLSQKVSLYNVFRSTRPTVEKPGIAFNIIVVLKPSSELQVKFIDGPKENKTAHLETRRSWRIRPLDRAFWYNVDLSKESLIFWPEEFLSLLSLSKNLEQSIVVESDMDGPVL